MLKLFVTHYYFLSSLHKIHNVTEFFDTPLLECFIEAEGEALVKIIVHVLRNKSEINFTTMK